jgi:hypothetical protein
MTKFTTYRRAFVVNVHVLVNVRDLLAAGELHEHPDLLVQRIRG